MMREINDLVFLWYFKMVQRAMFENIECLVNKECFQKDL